MMKVILDVNSSSAFLLPFSTPPPCHFPHFSLTSKQKTPGSPGAYQKQKIHQPCPMKNLTNQTQFSKSYSSYSFPKPFSLKKFTPLPNPSTTLASSPP